MNRDEIRDPIIKSVIENFINRSDVGFKKYRVTLDEDNAPLFVWLNHLQEELMDAVNYIEKLKHVITDDMQEFLYLQSKALDDDKTEE